MRQALHKLKYRRDLGLGEALAWPLARYVEHKLDWDVDMIIPVPLSPQRFAQRGYNQAALIAQPLAMIIDRKYCANALKRVKETRTQVGLSQRERQENVRNAFCADQGRIKNGKVLLVDDVATTGATLSSAAQALLDAGACHVYALTLARALSSRELDLA